VPAKSAELILRYRSGGGVTGNVPAESLIHPRGAIPKVHSVINPVSAAGGQDEESMDDLRARAGMQLHARDRVVTARDIDDISRTASPRIAATHCVPDVAGVRVYLVTAPLTPRDAWPVPLSELTPDDQLLTLIQAELDRRRLVGVNLAALRPEYRTIRVVAQIQPAPSVTGDAVRRVVEDRLYEYLSPISWTIGAPLKLAHLTELVQQIAGVASLHGLDIHEIVDGVSHRLSADLRLERDQLIVSGRHLVSTNTSGHS
jgi:predicted phage baseplate assembly protein